MTTPESPKFLPSPNTSQNLRGSERWSNITDALAVATVVISSADITYFGLIKSPLMFAGLGGIAIGFTLKIISQKLRPRSEG